MKALHIARRDLASYFNGWWGWVVVCVLLVVDGLFFNVLALGETERHSHEVLQQFFFNTGGVTIAAAALLTMTSFSQERNSGAEVLLASSPITDGQIVIGKWLAAFGMLFILTALTAYMPALIFVNGKVAVSHILVGYAGLLSIGGATCAVGILMSALVRTPYIGAIISGVLTIVIAVLMILFWYIADLTEPPFTSVLESAAFFENFMPFLEGRLRSDKLVFYASIVFGSLFVTTKVLSGRRWQ